MLNLRARRTLVAVAAVVAIALSTTGCPEDSGENPSVGNAETRGPNPCNFAASPKLQKLCNSDGKPKPACDATRKLVQKVHARNYSWKCVNK